MFGKRRTTEVIPFDAEPGRPLDADAPASSALSPPQLVSIEGTEAYRADVVDTVSMETLELTEDAFADEDVEALNRRDLAERVGALINDDLVSGGLNPRERRDVVTAVMNIMLSDKRTETAVVDAESLVERTKAVVQPLLMDRIDMTEAGEMPRAELSQEVSDVISEILLEQKIQLNLLEQRDLVTMLLNDMLGFGPLEVLLADETVTDIMVNGPDQVFIEKSGKLVLSEVTFRDNRHVMHIASRIVSGVGLMNRRHSMMRDCQTGPASTSSFRRWRLMGRRSRFVSFRKRKLPSMSCSAKITCRRKWQRC